MADRAPRSCHRADGRRKSVFNTKRLAKQYIRRGIRPSFGPRSSAVVYRCATCDGFHIGHKLSTRGTQ